MSWSVDRRDFMRILAAVGAGATAACTGRKKETILARFEPEANIVPGQSVYYATTCRECPAGCGVSARVMDYKAVLVNKKPVRYGNVKGSFGVSEQHGQSKTLIYRLVEK